MHAPLAVHAQAPAGPVEELHGMLNRLREPGAACRAQAAPLVQNPALDQAAALMGGGQDLESVLKAVGYRATRSQVFNLGGNLSAARLPGLLAQHFCTQIADATFSEAGAARLGNQVWVVMAAPFAPAVGLTREEIASQMLALVNAARAEARTCGDKPMPAAGPVRWNAVLEQAALGHSRDMAEHDYFSHTARDGSSPAQRVARAGYRYRATGENIASGQMSPADAVAGWIKSPPHCVNLMSAVYTEMGVAHAVNARSRMGVYWTQLFGTPQAVTRAQ